MYTIRFDFEKRIQNSIWFDPFPQKHIKHTTNNIWFSIIFYCFRSIYNFNLDWFKYVNNGVAATIDNLYTDTLF